MAPASGKVRRVTISILCLRCNPQASSTDNFGALSYECPAFSCFLYMGVSTQAPAHPCELKELRAETRAACHVYQEERRKLHIWHAQGVQAALTGVPGRRFPPEPARHSSFLLLDRWLEVWRKGGSHLTRAVGRVRKACRSRSRPTEARLTSGTPAETRMTTAEMSA